MKAFALYLLDGGRVLSSGTSFAPEDLAGPGQGVVVLESPCDPTCSYVEGGEVKAMPPSPGDGYEFDFAEKQWRPNIERLWYVVRLRRDQLIAATDWRLMVAQETGVPLSQAWRDYRQALRDITQQEDPANILWPEVPS